MNCTSLQNLLHWQSNFRDCRLLFWLYWTRFSSTRLLVELRISLFRGTRVLRFSCKERKSFITYTFFVPIVFWKMQFHWYHGLKIPSVQCNVGEIHLMSYSTICRFPKQFMTSSTIVSLSLIKLLCSFNRNSKVIDCYMFLACVLFNNKTKIKNMFTRDSNDYSQLNRSK